MAIKAGELIHVGNTVLLDRLQSAGPGSLGIPTEVIHELGNHQSVAQVRDTPDLSFPLDSFDVSAELEALLTGGDFGADPNGTGYEIANSLPLDVAAQFKGARGSADEFNTLASVLLPFLNLESLSYQFGIRDNSRQSASLRGDSVYFYDGSAFVQEAAGTGIAAQVITFDETPVPYNGDTVAGTRYAASVTIVEDGVRLTPGTDYTETATEVTITAAVAVTKTIRVSYQSDTVAQYPQVSHAAASATRPAAVKGKQIEVRVGGNTIADRWSSIQGVSVDYRVNVERDEELGNPNVVSLDYDIPAVSGSIELRTRDAAELFTRLRQITGVASGEVIGTAAAAVLPIDILIHSPEDGTVLKTLHIPDARFTVPGYSGQVQQRVNVTLEFESDGGNLTVYKGARA